MPVEQPFDIYQEQLTSLYHGLALWRPNPVENIYHQVSIGDVGYISEGVFIRMFNVTLPWNDESNRILGEPERYDSLTFTGIVREHFGQVDYYSRRVSREENTGNTQALSPEQAEGVTYRCRGRGALLVLPQGGHREIVIHRKVFEKYIRSHVVSWFNWSREIGLPVERMEDLVFVYGCTLVTSWAAAAFDDYTADAQVSLASRVVNNGGTSFHWSNIRGTVEYHDSCQLDPNGPHTRQNQCVFIKCFRAKRILFWTRHLRATAEPLPDDSDSSQENEIQVTQVSDVSNYRDPLIGVLDYIVEKRLDDIDKDDVGHVAITHHDDLKLIKDVEVLTADAVEQFLRENKVPLFVTDGAVMLRHPLRQIYEHEESESYGVSTTTSFRTSPISLTQSLVSTFPTSNPVRGSISPRDTPVSPPLGIPPVSSPPLVSFPSSSEPHRAVRTSPKSPGSYRFPPSLTAQDKAKFTRYFSKYSPVNGSLSGEKAREVFVKSKLPVEQLSQIWNLSDTQNRGSLDVADFIVAMYLIQASMSGQLPFIPTTLPPGLYEMASGQTLPGSAVASHTTGSSGSFSPGFPGSFPQNSGSLQPQYSGRPLQPQITGQVAQNQTGSASGLAPARNAPALAPLSPVSAPHLQPVWDVTPTEKATADKHFDGLDTQKRGYIEGDVAVPLMLQSKLPGDVLASIWDLADLNNDGRITRDGFAVAFHLVRRKLTGKEIPTILPASLMPPSMRVVVAPTASPFQHLPSDSPAISHPQPMILQPQRTVHSRFSAILAPQTHDFASNKDLLDYEDDAGAGASTTIKDHSADIGNLQNQLQSTTRSLENTRAEQNNVEVTVQNQAAQLSALQTQLSSAKAAYGAESRLLATLREHFSNQSSEIQKVKEELVRTESELSAIRLEQDEVEQNILHGKEEIRDLHCKMTGTGSTIEVVKAEIEKAKKELKQQKGLLVIAKKQLAAREAEGAKISQELQEVVAEVEEVTREQEMTEVELFKEPTAIQTSNRLSFASPPSLSGDSVPFSAAQPHPSSSSGSLTARSINPFERISGLQSPFLHSSVPTPAVVTSAQNEGTTTDNPFMFDQAFGDEEARPGPDVEAPSTRPERNVQLSTGKIVGELGAAVSEQVSEPSSDHGLFITPPIGPDYLKLPPPHATSLVPLEAHIDIDSHLKAGVAKEVVSNRYSLPQTAVEAVGAIADAQSSNPFLHLPAKDGSHFRASTSPFAVSPLAPPEVATLSDFDKAFGDFPGKAPTAGGKSLSFDNVFGKFTKAEPSASSLPATSVSSSGSAAVPPTSMSTSGIAKPSVSPVREIVFENAFRPQQNTTSSAHPVSVVDQFLVPPPVPESHHSPPTHTTPSQPPPVPDSPKRPFFDDDTPLLSPPRGIPSTLSSKTSDEEQGRYSKFSLHLPLGKKKKKIQDSLPPSEHLTRTVDRTAVEMTLNL
ncbi:hypothetical protein BJV77DRAFT_1065167 [Russula vinacea]|nr:hypothetical protein BJV77DRAFT_1065167 [Russula vinacea]